MGFSTKACNELPNAVLCRAPMGSDGYCIHEHCQLIVANSERQCGILIYKEIVFMKVFGSSCAHLIGTDGKSKRYTENDGVVPIKGQNYDQQLLCNGEAINIPRSIGITKHIAIENINNQSSSIYIESTA